MVESVLQKFATSQKAKDLLKIFLADKDITSKASALCGVCQMVGYKKGTVEIMKLLEGKHPLNYKVPLQTIERFWLKNTKFFSNKKLKITGARHLSMVNCDIILSKVEARLFYIHSKIVLGDFN